MKKISAQIVAHSRNEFGDEIVSLVCTFPRFILAEAKTHRVISGLLGEVNIEESTGVNDEVDFSKNSASSRAVPFLKMLEAVESDPFIPIAWQEDHSGMQGTKYLDDQPASYLNSKWTDQLKGKDILESIWSGTGIAERPHGTALYHAIECAKELYDNKATKQLANRLLEPFMWHTCIITSTEFSNFFNLRCPQYAFTNEIHKEPIFFKSKKDLLTYAEEQFKGQGEYLKLVNEKDPMLWFKTNYGQAEIHMMALAEAIWDAINESTAKELKAEEWHIPFGDKIDEKKLAEETYCGAGTVTSIEKQKVKIATARCARVSYINYEGKDNYEADIKLYDRLRASGTSSAFHASPFEHCAQAMSAADRGAYYKVEDGVTTYGQCRNFKGFLQLRALIEK